MKFHELAVGSKFKFNNEEFRKIPEVRASCCKIKENCENIATGKKSVLKPLDDVEQINEG